MTASAVSPLVEFGNGRITTTSQNVAGVFGKRHDNVLRDIEQIKANVPESFLLNFEEMYNEVPVCNGTVRRLPYYRLTRDGLVLLVMGYTGKKALAFKIAYIEAFNAMEAKLKEQAAIDQQATPSTVEDRRALVTLVNTWAQASGLPHSTLWPQVSGYFNLERISDLPKEWIGDAMAFVQERLDALAAAKSQPELSAPAETPALPNPDEEGPLVPALKQLKNLARQFLDVELDVYHNARGRVVVTTETPRVAVEANQCAEKLYSASLAMLEAYMSCARVLAYAFQQAGKAR